MSKESAHMDSMTERLVDFAEAAQYERLSGKTVHECKRRVIDTFASALGAYHEEPARMARAIASRTRGDAQATVWGSGIVTTPE
jgi:2-methylcitrate dehydratase